MNESALKRQLRRIHRRLRILSGKDIQHQIGKFSAVLPPDHYLAHNQDQFPFYDRYFIEFLRRYAALNSELCVIDIGANVGDTALAVLSAAPHARVISVEGSPLFLKYLRINTQPFDGVQLVEGFVTHRPGNWSYVTDNSTGHLIEEAEGRGGAAARFYTPSEILKMAGGSGGRIWKSDTDGYDIPILLGWFDEILAACEIVWIEFTPLGNLTNDRDIDALMRLIGASSRDVVVFDNFGHLMLRLRAEEAPSVLKQLNLWLAIQETGAGRFVGYFDLWILPPHAADLLTETAKAVPERPAHDIAGVD